ncbi:HNH endonuclease family protein [Leptothoe kymatousa]|uniref:HNH nuclease domain-containing protein n=1 Tax=Leptothoe kymatousa TAU-MAC 1615 TaxID=2364775 RepID=A0ABS5Y5S7_9CYAN|nr:hypothetical protein [Leptothoe kymatousa]MBT9313209.1 hypothetical protein [Leptothoe kymatousa TAU-MAC 1615]
MRKVIIDGNPPQSWIDDAKAVTDQLHAATGKAAREKIIKRNEKLWRDDRIRDWLLTQFNNKCWYTEAYESVSSIHVDHYRPKGRVRDLEGNEDDGYWRLAFNWKNYRICGQLINVKKSDVFPLFEGIRATSEKMLKLEAPVIIDPREEATRLISYEKDEDACIAVPSADTSDIERFRAENTIEVLGLNRLTRLNQKRANFWDDCLMAIADYKGGGADPLAIRLVHQASAIKELKKKVAYEVEFSSVSEACIRKHAPEPLIASVFERAPSISRISDVAEASVS